MERKFQKHVIDACFHILELPFCQKFVMFLCAANERTSSCKIFSYTRINQIYKELAVQGEKMPPQSHLQNVINMNSRVLHKIIKYKKKKRLELLQRKTCLIQTEDRKSTIVCYFIKFA